MSESATLFDGSPVPAHVPDELDRWLATPLDDGHWFVRHLPAADSGIYGSTWPRSTRPSS